jgi:hypothetical protein
VEGVFVNLGGAYDPVVWGVWVSWQGIGKSLKLDLFLILRGHPLWIALLLSLIHSAVQLDSSL